MIPIERLYNFTGLLNAQTVPSHNRNVHTEIEGACRCQPLDLSIQCLVEPTPSVPFSFRLPLMGEVKDLCVIKNGLAILK